MARDPKVWRITGSIAAMVSLFLVDHGGVLTLIDTGAQGPAQRRRILRGLGRAGRRPQDIRQIVLTHCHGDHTGEARHLKEVTGATVVAGREDVAVMQGQGDYPGPKDGISRALFGHLERFPRFEVDRVVAGREELDGGLVAVPAPGHTRGHLGVLAPRLSILFVGDALYGIGPLRPSWRSFTADVGENRETIRALATERADRVVISHGSSTTAGRLRDLAAHL
jgi:glyoxylase-like metal-dependent hydrolase (beta-lactamase superfamily II)